MIANLHTHRKLFSVELSQFLFPQSLSDVVKPHLRRLNIRQTTLNIVFNVTYYLELHNVIIIHHIFCSLRTKVKLFRHYEMKLI